MYTEYMVVESSGSSPKRAKRLRLGDTSCRNEAWLRDTLHQNPDILPIAEIDSSFGQLIPLCTELRTGSGPIDLAFINQHGRLTLVECKLWRNPEARREVVAQILDYARSISRWSYSDLQRQVSAATGITGNVPFELVRSKFPYLEEHAFVDATAAAMRQGRFMLLIAGDGIREDVGAIAELINRNAASAFAFGMVEVALYDLEGSALIIQPRVVARTQVIPHHVVVVQSETGSVPILNAEETGDLETGRVGRPDTEVKEVNAQHEIYRHWWKPVLAASIDDPDQEPPKLYWPNNVRLPLPWPGVWILLYATRNGQGELGACLAGRAGAYADFIERLRPNVDKILMQLPEKSEFRKFSTGDDFTFTITRSGSDFASDQEKTQWLAKMANVFVNVFRPIAKELIRDSSSPL
ncbi:PDDEXK family nuclease [Noviherbaspirillum galbum]|uniref:DUF4268 domain-containing protein n=1 Tax=Noviherbaspirillum galbum TaxID=2709383 RepID=A0A6B3SRM6_9BURK|nr:hypothetical protein [Noviherbaspirillum galbum]NEX63344.1 hypothetical protein [Noviherbaspirillum galbum]